MLCVHISKLKLNEIYGKAVTELSKSGYADTDSAAAGVKLDFPYKPEGEI